MSNLPAPTEGLPIHGPFLNLSASDAQRRRYFLRCWSRLIDAEPCPVDTGRVHGPARPTVADVAALYPSYAARGAFLVPLLRIARDA
jgi:hypothetical protein